MNKRNIYDLLKLKAKCILLEKKLSKSDLFVGEPYLEIHIDSKYFNEVVNKLDIKTVTYNANWNYQDSKFGEEYFYLTLYKVRFKIFALWKKGEYCGI